MSYIAPIKDMLFDIEHLADIAEIAEMPGFEDAGLETAQAVLEECARFNQDVIAPLNVAGDRNPSSFKDGVVTTTPGFKEAFAQYAAGGWQGLQHPLAFGGQGLPKTIGAACGEMLNSANMSFALCPLLSDGATEALLTAGSEALNAIYLEKLISGQWTGTMNLTEPQAGSDVGALTTRAVPHADGNYRVEGSKIYITWGEHDVADNIVHLVLARLPDAPPGTRGISLFLCPKILPDGSRNDLICAGLEHKLGIHASPTCTMKFGEHGDCVGYLVGAEGAGMRAMFTMMNHARINVGLQGVAIAERAYQAALAYARDRVQSAAFGRGHGAVRIIDHADVRRMLLTMKATTEAVRALAYYNAAAVDRAHAGGDAAATGLADLLTPVTKAYATDMGVELANLGIQVFGGMGYVEETGAAQYLRDARIAPIYEGTNGIQALDLVGRKLAMDGGAHWRALFADIRQTLRELPPKGDLGALRPYLDDALAALENATVWLTGNSGERLTDTAAGATPYLRMFGITVGGWLLARQAVAASERLATGDGDAAFLRCKITTARFFAEQVLPQATALLGPVTRGAGVLYAMEDAAWG